MELYQLTASELAQMLRNKECSSEEITKSVLNRIKETEDRVGSYVTITEETKPKWWMPVWLLEKRFLRWLGSLLV